MEMGDAIPQDALRALETAEPCRLVDLNLSCPRPPGVYTLWKDLKMVVVWQRRRLLGYRRACLRGRHR